MKRFFAVIMAIMIIASIAVLPASAANNAETKVTAKKGDEIVYSLNLTVPEKVVGCDLSIYYDNAELMPKASADFTGSFDADKQQAFLNHQLKGEAKCIFSILNGVDFKKEKTVFAVKFVAQKDIKNAHIKYYVRYLYPESMEQFKDYKFTCDVTVNGKSVVDSKAPELNVADKQAQGEFINSVTGDGKDANVNMAVVNNDKNTNGGDKHENNDKPVNNTDSGNTDKGDNDKNNKETTADKGDKTDNTSTVTENGGVDEPQSIITSTSDSVSDDTNNIFASPWLWIVIGVVVIGVAVGLVFVFKKKK